MDDGDVYVQCPFYLGRNGKDLRCEGVLDESRIQHQFRRKLDFDRHFGAYCCRSYSSCEIYRMLMKKYDKEDGA